MFSDRTASAGSLFSNRWPVAAQATTSCVAYGLIENTSYYATVQDSVRASTLKMSIYVTPAIPNCFEFRPGPRTVFNA